MLHMFIVHSRQPVCPMLTNALQTEPDMDVVGQATSLVDAMAQLPSTPCDLVRVDAPYPCKETLLFIRQTVLEQGSKVVVVGIEDRAFAFQCLQAGAMNYAERCESPAEVVHKLQSTSRKEALLSPEMAYAMVRRLAEVSQMVGWAGALEPGGFEFLSRKLTLREQEVLSYLAHDYTNLGIACTLTIELGTVKNHVHRLLKKLKVENRKQAALLASTVYPGGWGDGY